MPATIILIAVNVLTWLLVIFTADLLPLRHLTFSTSWFPLPNLWSMVTWPLIGAGNPLFLLFAAYWAYTIGGSLERSWGTRTLVLFFFATNALMAISVWVGSQILHIPGVLGGLWEALTPITIAWCLLNKRETVNLYFVPVPAMFLAYLALVFLWWEVGPPLLGLFALVPCAAAWWYADKGRHAYGGYGTNTSPFGGFRTASNSTPANRRTNTGSPEKAAAPFNPIKWWKRRQEDKRLAAMFRRSGYTDDDKK